MPMSVERYKPPQTHVTDVRAEGASTRSSFPAALVLRWLIGVSLLLYGLYRLALVATYWQAAADRAVIDIAADPRAWLIVWLGVLCTGALMLFRSKWLFVPLLAHVVVYSRQVLMVVSWATAPAIVMFFWAAQLLVFGFAAWLFLEGRLK
jgi:hypothetical protein